MGDSPSCIVTNKRLGSSLYGVHVYKSSESEAFKLASDLFGQSALRGQRVDSNVDAHSCKGKWCVLFGATVVNSPIIEVILCSSVSCSLLHGEEVTSRQR